MFAIIRMWWPAILVTIIYFAAGWYIGNREDKAVAADRTVRQVETLQGENANLHKNIQLQERLNEIDNHVPTGDAVADSMLDGSF